MSKGCKTVLNIIIGMVLGVVLFIGSIALTVYLVLTKVTVGDIQDIAKVDVLGDNEIVNKTLWDIISNVIEDIPEFGSKTLNDLENEYGVKFPDKIDFIDISSIKDVPFSELKDNIDKLFDKTSLADLTNALGISLPENISVITENRDKPVFDAWEAIVDKLDHLGDMTLGELDGEFNLGIYKEGADIHKALLTLRDKQVNGLAEAFNALLITDILDVFEYSLAEVSAAEEATHVFIEEYSDGYVYIEDADGAYYLTNERYRLLTDSELNSVPSNNDDLFVKAIVLTYDNNGNNISPEQKVEYIPYVNGDDYKTMVPVSYDEASAVADSVGTLYVWNTQTGVFDVYSGTVAAEQKYYVKKAVVYKHETADTDVFYEKWDKSKGEDVQRYARRYAEEVLFDISTVYSGATVMIYDHPNNVYHPYNEAAVTAGVAGPKRLIFVNGNIYTGSVAVNDSAVTATIEVFNDEGGTSLDLNAPAFIKKKGLTLSKDEADNEGLSIKITREASARALISMKRDGTNISQIETAITGFALKDLIDIQPDTILDLPQIKIATLNTVGGNLTNEMMDAKLADVLLWSKDSGADPVAVFLLGDTRLTDVLDAMGAQLNVLGDTWFTMTFDMNKLNQNFNYIIHVANNSGNNVGLGSLIIASGSTLTQSVIGNKRVNVNNNP
ncbi:MAG: hypothetical protein LBC13_01885 [Clostridiales bacterium]|jgi:hypothetical protein|nr:hypothetical protein [Clostridiales bacterium]